MDMRVTLNRAFVKIFRNILTIEENAIHSDLYQHATMNDMHVMEAIGVAEAKNMTTVARSLGVTTGTLTISVNGLVKKGFVERIRSEEDRRVVLISLTEKGKEIHRIHEKFHEEMIDDLVGTLSEEEKQVLQKVLDNLNDYMTKQRRA